MMVSSRSVTHDELPASGVCAVRESYAACPAHTVLARCHTRDFSGFLKLAAEDHKKLQCNDCKNLADGEKLEQLFC